LNLKLQDPRSKGKGDSGLEEQKTELGPNELGVLQVNLPFDGGTKHGRLGKHGEAIDRGK